MRGRARACVFERFFVLTIMALNVLGRTPFQLAIEYRFHALVKQMLTHKPIEELDALAHQNCE